MKNKPPELTLDSGGSVGQEGFAVFEHYLDFADVESLVEFGSGASTAELAANLPDTEILSIEHSAKYYEATRELLQEKELPQNHSVDLRPLDFQRFGRAIIYSYRNAEFPRRVDAVVIDGPPMLENHRGREACLYQVYDRLPVGSKVFLDDYDRPWEQAIVSNWLRVFPGAFELNPVLDGKICLLKKIRNIQPHYENLNPIDHLAALGNSGLTKLKVRMYDFFKDHL